MIAPSCIPASEEWRVIPGFEGFYEASSLGQIRSVTRTIRNSTNRIRVYAGRLIKQRDGFGYRLVPLCKCGNEERFRVHRLVMLAFVGPSDLEVNHKNGIKHDNRLENLEYCTHAENQHHKVRVLESHSGKLQFKDAEEIRRLYAAGGCTLQQLASKYGVHHSTIGGYLNHRYYATDRASVERKDRRKRLVSFQGATRSIAEWARVLGINKETIAGRLRSGVPVELALQPVSA